MGKRRGRSLERIVAALEKLTANDSNLSVTSPARLRDIDSGQLREIDVLLEYQSGNHVSTIGIECKDLAIPVGSPAVEAFYAKTKALPIDKAVLVSTSGFTKPSIVKASKQKVLLQSLSQSVSYDWCNTAGVLEDAVVFKNPPEVEVELNGNWCRAEKLKSTNGKVVKFGDLLDCVGYHLLSYPTKWKRGDGGHAEGQPKYPINVANLRLRGLKTARVNGRKLQVKNARINVSFEFHRIFTTFVNRTISGSSKDTEFVKASLALRDNNGETILVRTSMSNDVAVIFPEGSTSNSDLIRQYIRFTTWEELTSRLKETGDRHHINIADSSDTLSVSRYVCEADVSQANAPFDGVDRFSDGKLPGVSTVTLK